MELTISHLADVHRAVYEARAKWYDIGLQLELLVGTLDSIQRQFGGHPGDCLRETLKRWLQRGPRLQSLFDALRSPTVGEERLALELERSNILQQGKALARRRLRGVPTGRKSVGMRTSTTSWNVPVILSAGCILLFLLLVFTTISYQYRPNEDSVKNMGDQLEVNSSSTSHYKVPPRKKKKAVKTSQAPSSFDKNAPNNLPHLRGPFVGRESDVFQITSMLIHSPKVGIVGIFGPPAVGKSTLAIHIGHRMVRHRVAVRYINLIDVHLFKRQPDSSASFSHSSSSSQQTGTEVSTYPENTALSVTWYSPTKQKYVTQTALELVEWAKGITNHTLLILDNCDDVLEKSDSLKKKFQNMILALQHSSSLVKLIVTSRLQLAIIGGFKAYRLKELDLASAVELLQAESDLLNARDSQTIAELVGNNPLALRIVATLVSEIHQPTKVIHELKQNPVETLSPQSLPESQQIFHVLEISYKHLDMGGQRCGHHFSFFPGSFSENAALHILELCNFNRPYICLQKLVSRSLLELYSLGADQYRYHFHRLIQEFFKYHQIRGGISELSEYKAMGIKFSTAFQAHYSHELSLYSVKHQLDPLDEKVLHELEYDTHNFIELLKKIADKPRLSPRALICISQVLTETSMLTNLFASIELLQPMQKILVAFGENLNAISQEIGIQKTLSLYQALLSKAKYSITTQKLDDDMCKQLCTEAVEALGRVEKLLQNYAYNISLIEYFYQLSMSVSYSTILCSVECKDTRNLWTVFLITMPLASVVASYFHRRLKNILRIRSKIGNFAIYVMMYESLLPELFISAFFCAYMGIDNVIENLFIQTLSVVHVGCLYLLMLFTICGFKGVIRIIEDALCVCFLFCIIIVFCCCLPTQEDTQHIYKMLYVVFSVITFLFPMLGTVTFLLFMYKRSMPADIQEFVIVFFVFPFTFMVPIILYNLF